MATTNKGTNEYWAVSLDDFVTELFDWLGTHQDGGAGHYACYEGTKEVARDKLLLSIGELVDKMIYQSDDYGCPVEWKSE